jgi:ABC-type sugar transport system ATPase subunit
MAELQLRNVRKSFGTVDVIRGVDRTIKSGEFMVFVGPSGCGKSTLLRLVAGLETISGGTLSFDGEVVNNLAPSKRGIAMVFQSYALYPHMTVYDNMAFGMQLAHAGRDQIKERVLKGRIFCRSPHISSACPRSSRAVSGSASRSAAPSCATPRCSCSTSHCRTSTRHCASRPASRSPSCITR